MTVQISTYQKGGFTVKSSKGHQYIMLAYVRDPNFIMAQSIENRPEKELVDGYSVIYNKLQSKVITPSLKICDI